MVHAYKMGGRNLVLDTCSGAVHLVDELAYEVIRLFENRDGNTVIKEILRSHPDWKEEEIAECVREVEQLKAAGQLFAPDTFQEKAGALKAKTAGVVKALCLHVAHSCNLTCSYCFAGQGRFHGKNALMSYDVGKQALDFLIAHSGSRRNLEVDFFGGEPLLNFDVVKRLTAYARSVEKDAGKHFRFTLTTNGMLIDDEVIDFCNREMDNVVLSLDGRREVHDRFRVDAKGNGSWETVVPKFQKLVSARGGQKYYMRGTFTHYNPDFLQDIQTMLDLGFTELSMEPVVCAPDSPSALTDADIEIVKDQYEKLAQKMHAARKEGHPFTFYHYMLDLSHGPCVYKRISGCGSGTEYMAVTPWGDLYPCHQFVGEERFRLGNIYEGVTNLPVRQEFMDCNVYAREACRNCWARLYCSGGCAANAWHAAGDIRGVYEKGCELFKKRIECAVWLEAMRMEEEEEKRNPQ